MRYPGSLLARYHRSDLRRLIAASHSEADSIAGQLLKAMDAVNAGAR